MINLLYRQTSSVAATPYTQSSKMNSMNNQIPGSEQNVTEITGRPGQVWGTVVIPTGGKTTMRIVGDTLQTTTKVNFGLEKKEVFTRIQKIDSVEIVEGRIWWLLVLGLATVMGVIGFVFIVLFFAIKQNWIVVRSSTSSLILFHSDNSRVKQFCSNLLTISRQLNAHSISNNSTSKRPSQNMPSKSNGANGKSPLHHSHHSV
jgi:hypothetical protein